MNNLIHSVFWCLRGLGSETRLYARLGGATGKDRDLIDQLRRKADEEGMVFEDYPTSAEARARLDVLVADPRYAGAAP